MNNKLLSLRKYNALFEKPVTILTPVELINSPKYSRYHVAKIIKTDHDRLQIIDYIISNLYKTHLLLTERHWQEAFLTLFANLTVVELFNEFILCIKHTMMLAILLLKMDIQDKAMEVFDYLRDLVEDTNNNKEAILVYQQMGKMYQEDKEYKMALISFKRMLQAAWVEND